MSVSATFCIYFTMTILSMTFIYLASKYKARYRCRGNISLTNDKVMSIFLFVMAVSLFSFVSGFRYNVGTDYSYTYYPAFYKMLDGAPNEYLEPAMNMIIRITHWFSNEAVWIFIITSVIYSSVMLYVIFNYSDNPFLSVGLFVISGIFFVSMNNVRSAIAAAFGLLALVFSKEKRPIAFIVSILFGLCFHLSSLLFLAFYPMMNIRFIRKNWYIISILLILFAYPLTYFLAYIISFTKYKYYFESYFVGGGVIKYELLLNFFIYLILAFCFRKTYKNDDKVFAFMACEFIAFYIAFLSFFINVSELMSRLVYLFSYSQILLVPYVYNNLKNIKLKISFIGSVLFIYSFYIVYYIVINEYHEVIHYMLYWNK